jgi:hypothetical protein
VVGGEVDGALAVLVGGGEARRSVLKVTVGGKDQDAAFLCLGESLRCERMRRWFGRAAKAEVEDVAAFVDGLI